MMLLILVSSVLVGCSPVVASEVETATPVPQEVDGALTIKGVQVDADRISVSGTSALPDGTCILTALRANGQEQAWWSADACATVQQGAWQMVVLLEQKGAPAHLEKALMYEIKAWQKGQPSTGVVFPFDLAGPVAPGSMSSTGNSAAQLSKEAQIYVELSQADLAQKLGIPPDQIKLESITEPATSSGTFVVVLTAEGHTYEYHGSNQQVTLVSSSYP
jgi:hypothetical protein